MLSDTDGHIPLWLKLSLLLPLWSNMAAGYGDELDSTTSTSRNEGDTMCSGFQSLGPGRGAVISSMQVVEATCWCYSSNDENSRRPECPVWSITKGQEHLKLNNSHSVQHESFCKSVVRYSVQPNMTVSTDEVAIRCSVPGFRQLQEDLEFKVKDHRTCSDFQSIGPAAGATISPWQVVEATCWCHSDDAVSRRPKCPVWSITKGQEHLSLNNTHSVPEERYCKSVVRYHIQPTETSGEVAIRCSVPGNKELQEDFHFRVKGLHRSVPSSNSSKKDLWIYSLLAVAGVMFIASIAGVIIQHRKRQKRGVARKGAYRKGRTSVENSIT